MSLQLAEESIRETQRRRVELLTHLYAPGANAVLHLYVAEEARRHRLRRGTDATNVEIYTTVNFARYSVTEVGALPAAGWAWSVRGRHALRWEVGVAGWAWLLHGKQT